MLCTRSCNRALVLHDMKAFILSLLRNNTNSWVKGLKDSTRGSLGLARFVGDVSRVFLATVLHGLGTKPAGVLLFRMRSPKTFFLGFAWLPAGFPSFCFFLVGSKGNVSAIFLAAVSQWLRDKTCWGSAFRCAKHFSSIFAGFRRFAIFQ